MADHQRSFTQALRMTPIRTLLLAAFLLPACSKAPTPVPPPAPAVHEAAEVVEPPPPPPPEDDCTLATKLKDGIPGSPGHLIKSARNPNGDSELAVLMRQFVDDVREARTLLEAGQPVKNLYPTYRQMRCMWLTKPDERNANFDGRAIAFLGVVQAYDSKPGKETYNGIINGCIACHSQSCGGPLDFIDSMKW